jgi:AcrR family transcriptional regulator
MVTFEVDDRFYEAAEEWADRRMQDTEQALETKAEQSLLEIEHLISEIHTVDLDFEVKGRQIRYEPTPELAAFLRRQAADTGLDESDVLKMHVDLYANAFLEEAASEERPPNAPPTE